MTGGAAARRKRKWEDLIDLSNFIESIRDADYRGQKMECNQLAWLIEATCLQGGKEIAMQTQGNCRCKIMGADPDQLSW